MNVVFSLEEMPVSFGKSIFLAGPTRRTVDVESWRPYALAILEDLGYDGVVFVPENREGVTNAYDSGLYPVWEHAAMDRSDAVVFWVPRDLETLPAFTTNVEFGLLAKSGKAVFGAPNSAPKNGYLRFIANKYDVPQFDTLEATLGHTVSKVGSGATRIGGECEVPLFLWQTPSFQKWYLSHTAVGNRLDGIQVEWVKRFGNNRERVWAWAVHPDFYVAGEQRHKTNDAAVSRTDIAATVLYRKNENAPDYELVLIREFRTAVVNKDGFVWSIPSGSSSNLDLSAAQVAAEEIREETGLMIDPDRLVPHGEHQLMASFSTHSCALFSAELSEIEMAYMQRQKGKTHGVDAGLDNTGERTYVEVLTIRQILDETLLDWSTLGMIFKALALS